MDSEKQSTSSCCVCSEENLDDSINPIMICKTCRIAVHKACYGSAPSENWNCTKCKKKGNVQVSCVLCPSKEGAFKPTTGDAWVHVVCSLYIMEVAFVDTNIMEPVNIVNIPKARYEMECYLCVKDNLKSGRNGACIKCSFDQCCKQFHVTCAQKYQLLREETKSTKKSNNEKTLIYNGYCLDHIEEHDHPKEDLKKSKPGSRSKKSSKSRKKSSISTAEVQSNASKYTLGPERLPQMALDSACFGQQLTAKSTDHSRLSTKFTTSNFVESVVTPSESVFANMGQDSGDKKKKDAKEDLDDDDSVLKIVEEPNLSAVGDAAFSTSSTANAPGSSFATNSAPTTEYGTSSYLTPTFSESNTKESFSQRKRSMEDAPGVGKISNGTKEKQEQESKLAKGKRKDEKPGIQNGLTAPHMLGNQLNPSSSMAQSMCDTLTEELEAHSTQADKSNSTLRLVGPPLLRSAPTTTPNSTPGRLPPTLEELLEVQWNQTGTYLMEQADHFDSNLASMLSCTYKLLRENAVLEKSNEAMKNKVSELMGTNARLAISLENVQSQSVNAQGPLPNVSDYQQQMLSISQGQMQTPSTIVHSSQIHPQHQHYLGRSNQNSPNAAQFANNSPGVMDARRNSPYPQQQQQQQPAENGIPSSSHFQQRNMPPISRHSNILSATMRLQTSDRGMSSYHHQQQQHRQHPPH